MRTGQIGLCHGGEVNNQDTLVGTQVAVTLVEARLLEPLVFAELDVAHVVHALIAVP